MHENISLLETVVKPSVQYQVTAHLGPFLECIEAKKAYWSFSDFSVTSLNVLFVTAEI